jgi:hypothetical protein
VLFPCAKYGEIVSCPAIHHNFFNFTFQDHPGDTLEGIFKTAFTFLDSSQVVLEPVTVFGSHFSFTFIFDYVQGSLFKPRLN